MLIAIPCVLSGVGKKSTVSCGKANSFMRVRHSSPFSRSLTSSARHERARPHVRPLLVPPLSPRPPHHADAHRRRLLRDERRNVGVGVEALAVDRHDVIRHPQPAASLRRCPRAMLTTSHAPPPRRPPAAASCKRVAGRAIQLHQTAGSSGAGRYLARLLGQGDRRWR